MSTRLQWLFYGAFGVACAVEPAKSIAPQETKNPTSCQERPRLANFDSAPLGEVVKAISEATCKTFVVTEELKQRKITLLAPTELAPAPLLDALQKALSVNALELQEKDGVWSVTQTLKETPLTAPSEEETLPMGEPTTRPGIERTGDFAVTIERKVIDAMLSDLEGVANEAKVIPYMKDGVFTGFKLYAIRPTSLFAALGFKNGDILQTVNGKKMDSLEAAMGVLSMLATESELQIGLIRRGGPITLIMQIK